MVNELRLECAERDNIGRKRTGAAVAWSLQRYLIFALLSCIPGTPRSYFLPISRSCSCFTACL